MEIHPSKSILNHQSMQQRGKYHKQIDPHVAQHFCFRLQGWLNRCKDDLLTILYRRWVSMKKYQKKERRNMFSINTNRSFEMTGDECVVILLESSYSFLALAIIAICFWWQPWSLSSCTPSPWSSIFTTTSCQHTVCGRILFQRYQQMVLYWFCLK